MDFAQKLNLDFYVKLRKLWQFVLKPFLVFFSYNKRQMFTVLLSNIDCISPLRTKILPSALCRAIYHSSGLKNLTPVNICIIQTQMKD